MTPEGRRATFEATLLRGSRYAVRPAGQLGTCGFHPVPWTVIYVNARSPSDAIRKALSLRNHPAPFAKLSRGHSRRASRKFTIHMKRQGLDS